MRWSILCTFCIWLQLWLEFPLVTRCRQYEFIVKYMLNVFQRVYLWKSYLLTGTCRFLMSWRSLWQSGSQTRRSWHLSVSVNGQKPWHWLYLQVAHMKDCACDCRDRERRKDNRIFLQEWRIWTYDSCWSRKKNQYN